MLCILFDQIPKYPRTIMSIMTNKQMKFSSCVNKAIHTEVYRSFWAYLLSVEYEKKSWSLSDVLYTSNHHINELLSRKSRNVELRTQKLKSHLLRTQSIKVLPRVSQYIAIHATLTAGDFFLAYFYPSDPFTRIFSKTSPNFFLCWLWLTPAPV